MIEHLKPSIFVRRIRIVTRFFKQKLEIEEFLYTPSILFIMELICKYELVREN